MWAKKCQRNMLTAHIANELIPELERTTSYRAGRFGFNFQPEVSRNALAGKKHPSSKPLFYGKYTGTENCYASWKTVTVFIFKINPFRNTSLFHFHAVTAVFDLRLYLIPFRTNQHCDIVLKQLLHLGFNVDLTSSFKQIVIVFITSDRLL